MLRAWDWTNTQTLSCRTLDSSTDMRTDYYVPLLSIFPSTFEPSSYDWNAQTLPTPTGSQPLVVQSANLKRHNSHTRWGIIITRLHTTSHWNTKDCSWLLALNGRITFHSCFEQIKLMDRVGRMKYLRDTRLRYLWSCSQTLLPASRKVFPPK